MIDDFDDIDAMTEFDFFDSERVYQELDSNRTDIALLLTATMTEAGLRYELIDYLEISHSSFDELRGNAGLGYYVNNCNKYDIIDNEYRESFDNLVKKRNALVHDFGYLDKLVQNDEETKAVRGIIDDCSDWFDSRPSYPR